MKVKSESEVALSCRILSDPTDCGLPSSSIHGSFQVRILEWGAIAFSATIACEVAQSCLTLCGPMDCSLLGSPVHGIFLGKGTGVGCHFFLQRIFLTQGPNPGLPHCRQTLVNSREGTQLHPSTENWIKDLLSMAPSIRTRPSFPLSQSLPSGSFHKPVILLHQGAQTVKTTITEN